MKRQVLLLFMLMSLIAAARDVTVKAQTVASTVGAGETNARLSLESSDYKFAKRDWDAMTSALHTANPPSNAQIQSFVMAMLKGDPDTAADGMSICSAGFFKLSDDESYSLVASMDVNGRHFCNDIEVIVSSDKGLTIQTISAWEVDQVADIVRQLDETGKSELVVREEASEYVGANSCMATWTRIYALESGVLVDRSAAFKEFYKQRLDSLIAKIPQVKDDDEDGKRDNVVCVQMEIDRIERFLGVSPNAGEDKALDWVNSDNPFLRLKGIGVLADIGDERAIGVLQSLTADGNSMVADAAKRAMVAAQKK